jgi:putative transposase
LLIARIDALRDAVRQGPARAPLHIDAWVALPDHMHCLWTLPQGDANFPSRWWAIKTAFVKSSPIGGLAITGHGPAVRTRHLAAAVLGAHDQL